MSELNISQEFIDETRNYLIEDNSISTVTRCVSISAFAALIGIPIGITSSATELKICEIIKKYKSIITIKKKNHDKILLLAKSKLNSVDILISKDLIDSNISYNEFVSINDVLKVLYIRQCYLIV